MVDLNVSGRLMPHIWVQFEPNDQGYISPHNCVVWDLRTGQKMPRVRSLELTIEPGTFTAVVSYFADESGKPCEGKLRNPYRLLMTECVVDGMAITPPPEDAIDHDGE